MSCLAAVFLPGASGFRLCSGEAVQDLALLLLEFFLCQLQRLVDQRLEIFLETLEALLQLLIIVKRPADGGGDNEPISQPLAVWQAVSQKYRHLAMGKQLQVFGKFVNV